MDAELAQLGIGLQAANDRHRFQIDLAGWLVRPGWPVLQTRPALVLPARQRLVDQRAGDPQVAGDRLGAPALARQTHDGQPALHGIGHRVVGREAPGRADRQGLAGQHPAHGVVVDRAGEAVLADARDLAQAERWVFRFQGRRWRAESRLAAAGDPPQAPAVRRRGCACRSPRSAPPGGGGCVLAPRFPGRGLRPVGQRGRSAAAARRFPVPARSPAGGVGPTHRWDRDAVESCRAWTIPQAKRERAARGCGSLSRWCPSVNAGCGH